jgi:hypothetical protein
MCLFFFIVPIAVQAFIQTLHKLNDTLVVEVSRQSILPIHNCFFHFIINCHPFVTQKLCHFWEKMEGEGVRSEL